MRPLIAFFALCLVACGPNKGPDKTNPPPTKDPKLTTTEPAKTEPNNSQPATAQAASLPMPEVGVVAPPVKLKNQRGEEVDVASFVGKNAVVLYFYPKDDTPGCTIEAKDFRDRSKEIEGLGAKIFGVSLDPVDSHEAFADKFDLTFDILSDSTQEVAKAYGVLTMHGDTPISKRTTFLIGKDGKIKKVFTDVQVNVHGEEVVKALKDGLGG